MGRLYDWLRARLVIIIFAAILVLECLNWQATRDLARSLPRDPPRCDVYNPCFVKTLP